MQRRMFVNVLCLGAAVATLLTAGRAQADWPRFRGPNGAGFSEDAGTPPTNWSPADGVKWKTPLPGAGVSSPIVVGDRIFVTCYSGYGEDRQNPGNMEDLKRHLVCIDRNSGDIVWQKTIDAVLPEDPYSGPGVPTHGYASHTPVSDGERVYVFFGKTGALAFDLDGNQLWQKGVGTESDPRRWGSSSSPILWGKYLIVTASAESEALVALDTATGEEAWRAEAAGLANTWGTPILVDAEAGRTEIVISVPGEIWGLNPENGKLLWYCAASNSDQANTSVVSAENVVFAVEGRGGGAVAVRTGGKGDVSDSHVVWTGRDSSRFSSPILYDGRLFSITNGIVSCTDAKTGNSIYQERLQASGGEQEQPERGRGGRGRGGFGGGDYSSPIIAGGKLYYVRAAGEVVVLGTGEKFEQIAVNRLTADRENFMATPAASNGQLFIRSDKHLYCVSSPE